MREEWFHDKYNVGLTAGASAPEVLIQQVISQLKAWGFKEIIIEQGAQEHIIFVLPKKLRTEQTPESTSLSV